MRNQVHTRSAPSDFSYTYPYTEKQRMIESERTKQCGRKEAHGQDHDSFERVAQRISFQYPALRCILK